MPITSIRFEYEFVPEHGTTFERATPASFSSSRVAVRIENDHVIAAIIGECDDVNEARALVEPVLRDWQIGHALRLGIPEFHLERETVSFEDTDPRRMHALAGKLTVSANLSAELTVSRRAYPLLEPDFTATPLVETLWHRYRGYQTKREPLLSMAYFCLTAIEIEAGGRGNAASRFRVEPAVLRRIGELTSTRGDGSSARKATKGQKPLTANEQNWLETAVRTLIFKIGQTAANPGTAQLRLGDLPSA